MTSDKYLSAFLLSLMALGLSCTKSNVLVDFFKVAEIKIGPELTLQFKNTSEDSVMVFAYDKLETIINDNVFSDKEFFSKLNLYFEEQGIGSFFRFRYLMYSFHKFLNNTRIEKSEILILCERDFISYRFPRKVKATELAMRLNWISLYNFNHFEVFDTMLIDLPLVNYDSIRAEYQNGMLANVDYRNGSSNFITGVLLEKRFKTATHEYYEYYPIEFKVKILDFNNKLFYDNDDQLTSGDSVWLNLYLHGRFIRKKN